MRASRSDPSLTPRPNWPGIRSPYRETDDGVSLVELLIVILLIAILASIAIVIMISQREKAYISQVKSSLRNAASAMEGFATDNAGSYEGATLSDLSEEGLRYPNEITFSLDPDPDKTTYCIVATHSRISSTNDWRVSSYNNLRGSPSDEDACLIPGKPPKAKPTPKNSPKK